jgi:uncharacterized protein (DUF169 family)
MKLSKAYQDLNTLLRLRTYPVAVKYFPNFDEDLEAYLMDEGFVGQENHLMFARSLV